MAQPSEAVTSLVYVRLTLQQAWDECGGDDFVIAKCKGTNITNSKIFNWLISKFVKLIYATSSRELDCRIFLSGCLFLLLLGAWSEILRIPYVYP